VFVSLFHVLFRLCHTFKVMHFQHRLLPLFADAPWLRSQANSFCTPPPPPAAAPVPAAAPAPAPCAALLTPCTRAFLASPHLIIRSPNQGANLQCTLPLPVFHALPRRSVATAPGEDEQMKEWAEHARLS